MMLALVDGVQAGCPDGFTASTNNCYVALTTEIGDLSLSRTRCQALGAGIDLAIIPSAEDQTAAVTAIGDFAYPLWIGLIDSTADNGYHDWIDSTPRTYGNWWSGQPDNTLHRCAAIQAASAFKWTDEPCSYALFALCSTANVLELPNCVDDNPCQNGVCSESADALTCNCSGTGYEGDDCGTDINECSSNNGGCDHTCSNSNGSYTCSCNSGFSLNADGHACDDIDECATNNGGCAHSCNNSAASYACSCNSGYSLNADNHSCDDINECATRNGGCGHKCKNYKGSYTCVCDSGYSLNNHTCADIDECATSNGGCDHTCRNYKGGYTCSCNSGFRLNADGYMCDNIDECSESLDNCDANAACGDTTGSFTCACNPGFVGDGVTCLVATTIMEDAYPMAPKDNRIRFKVDFGVVVSVTAASFSVATSAGMSTNNSVLTPISSRSVHVEVVVTGPLVSGTVTLSLAQGATAPRNTAASAVATYAAPTPLIFSPVLGNAATPGMDYEFTIHVQFETPVVGFTAGMLHIDSASVVVDWMNMTVGPNADHHSFHFRLGAPAGTISFSVNDTYGTAVTPAHAASNTFTIDYIGRCANTECSGDDGSPRVCGHFSGDGGYSDSTCYDFLRTASGDIMYPIVCPPGTSVCQEVDVPAELPLAEGWCTSCAGESSGPCQHVSGGGEGTCYAFLDAATKMCPPGTITCNECDRLAPCDHGSCVDLVNDYTCMCEPSWMGKDCDNHDDCAVHSCASTGACVDGTGDNDGSYTCKCDPGYEGEFCATEINECDAAPCQNGGVCTDLLADYSCDCSGTGFTGTDCDVDINECATNNGGCDQTCTNTDGSYSCSCDAGYTLNADSHACDDIDECATNNGGCEGTCTNNEGSYRCSCSSGFEWSTNSHTCEDTDECATNNGGCDQTCTNNEGSYSCSCGAGFTINGDSHA